MRMLKKSLCIVFFGIVFSMPISAVEKFSPLELPKPSKTQATITKKPASKPQTKTTSNPPSKTWAAATEKSEAIKSLKARYAQKINQPPKPQSPSSSTSWS